MYTILVNQDNSLTKSKVERIMQGSSMVDQLHFLVDEDYKGEDMHNYTVTVEYMLPQTRRKYKVEFLTPSEELYKGKIEYIVPFDTYLTAEAGEVEVKLLFMYLEMDSEGNFIEHTRATDSTFIKITPVEQWSSYIPDANLDNIAQMVLKNQAQIAQIQECAELIQMIQINKADDLSYENNELQLTSNGQKIGTSVTIKACEGDFEDGVPVVDLDDITADTPGTDDDQEESDVVEF